MESIRIATVWAVMFVAGAGAWALVALLVRTV